MKNVPYIRVFLFVLILSVPIALSQSNSTNEPQARKVDEFGRLNKRDRKARLYKFEEKIECGSSDKQTYVVIIYPTRSDDYEELSRRTLDNLVRKRCFDPPKIVAYKGSVKRKQKTELWIVPNGAMSPIPR